MRHHCLVETRIATVRLNSASRACATIPPVRARAALGAVLLPGTSQIQLTALAAPVHQPAGDCQIFPRSNNYLNRDINRLLVHTRIDQWHMSPTRKLHPDFGPSYGDDRYGIPSPSYPQRIRR